MSNWNFFTAMGWTEHSRSVGCNASVGMGLCNLSITFDSCVNIPKPKPVLCGSMAWSLTFGYLFDYDVPYFLTTTCDNLRSCIICYIHIQHSFWIRCGTRGVYFSRARGLEGGSNWSRRYLSIRALSVTRPFAQHTNSLFSHRLLLMKSSLDVERDAIKVSFWQAMSEKKLD